MVEQAEIVSLVDSFYACQSKIWELFIIFTKLELTFLDSVDSVLKFVSFILSLKFLALVIQDQYSKWSLILLFKH